MDALTEDVIYARAEDAARVKVKRTEAWTVRIVAVVVGLCFLAAVAAITWSVNEAAKRNEVLQTECQTHNGIWMPGNTCAYSGQEDY